METSSLNNTVDLEDERPCLPREHLGRGSGRLHKQWPPMIWFIMKITGLFYHPQIVTKRWCISCEMDKIKPSSPLNRERKKHCDILKQDVIDMTTCYEGSQESQSYVFSVPREEPCKACEARWWDRYGQVSRYTEADIGLKPWNHRGSWLVSLFILLFVVSLILFEAISTEQKLFAKRELLLHFMSYTAFLFPLFVFPVMNVCSKIKSAFSGGGLGIWATSLNARYIVQQLQYLDLSKDGLPSKGFLILCIVWPICCSTYRTYITFALKGHLDLSHRLTCFTVGVTEFIWGCFVYLLFLIRFSFQIQLEVFLDFIKRCEGEEELCRSIIRRIAVDFICFRDCVAVYMMMMIPLCVLGASTSITWQYLILTHVDKNCSSLWCTTERNTNIMIWSEVLMFSSLGPFAIGGFDVNYLWENLELNIKFMQDQTHKKFWRKLVHFIERTQEKVPYISATTVMSLVSMYMAFQFDEQAINDTDVDI